MPRVCILARVGAARTAGSFLVLAALTTGALMDVASANPIPVVRVMVEREKNEIQINGFDLVVSESISGKTVAEFRNRAQVSFRCSLGGKVTLHTNKQTTPIAARGALTISSLGGFIRVGGNQYRDDLYLYSFNGDCLVVNHVDIEKYVAGLLSSEMSSSWSLEALRAQAVAARTYAIYQMQESSTAKYRGLKPPFDLDSSVKDQVYEGAQKERYRTMQAVQETRGEVLTYDQKPIKAFYHSTCGGQTESPEKVWGLKLPYLRSVKCGHCNKSPRFNWVFNIPVKALEVKLHMQNLLRGGLLSLRVLSRNRIGRADKVEVVGTQGSTVLAAKKLRDLLGTSSIRSTDFNVARSEQFVAFIGRGSGHAVGMCQWGAKGMGDLGYNYRKILKHYYPAAEISRLY